MGISNSTTKIISADEDELYDYGAFADISSKIKDPNGLETGELVWLMNFAQFALYGKYPPPKPKHSNLSVR